MPSHGSSAGSGRGSHLQLRADPYATIEGAVARITYFSEETQYVVARLDVPGKPDPVTIVGTVLSLTPDRHKYTGTYTGTDVHGDVATFITLILRPRDGNGRGRGPSPKNAVIGAARSVGLMCAPNGSNERGCEG